MPRLKTAHLIPQPKADYPEPGSFAAPPGAAVHCPSGAAAVGRRVGALLALPVRLNDSNTWSIVVGADPQAPTLVVPDKPDAYALAVEPERIRMSAASYRGLVYAATTLEEVGNGCGRIVDFADLPVRGIHLDLKGPAIRFEYLLSLVERLGRAKINTLLIEYEDKFPFRAFPELLGPGAFSREQLQQLLALAAEWGMEVIPLVQCLGHAEYILKHPAYRYLAEDENLAQLCPQLEGALPFFAGMVAEIVQAHQGLRYVHIGGDESWCLGNCPKCRAVVEAKGKHGLYVDHVKRAAEVVVGHGLRPIIWDDMFHEEKAHHLLDELPAATALMVWDYQVYEDETSHVRWGGRRYASRRYAGEPGRLLSWEGWLEDLPEGEQELIRTVKFAGAEAALGDPVPWVRAIQARGHEIFGAPACKGADLENSLWPSGDQRYENVAVWARRASESAIAGVISTAWSRFGSYRPPVDPWETAWYTTLASAELYWNSHTPRSRFDEKYGPVAQALQWMAQGRRTTTGGRKYLYAAQELFRAQGERVLELCAAHEILTQITNAAERYAGWHLYYVGDPDPTRLPSRASVVRELTDLERQWEAWERQAEDTFAVELHPAGVAELIGTKNAAIRRKIAWLKARLTEEM